MRLRRSRPGWLTLVQVARLMSTPARSVCRSTVHRLEQGDLKQPPDPWLVRRYAVALELPEQEVRARLPAAWRRERFPLDSESAAAS
jgi:hypothetical protein